MKLTVLPSSNDYYGGIWASFNLKILQEQLTKPNGKQFESDSCLRIGNDIFNIKNFSENWHILEHSVKENVIQESKNDQKCLEEKFQENVTIPEIKEEIQITTDTKEEPFSKDSLLNNSRRFNIDLIPKVF